MGATIRTATLSDQLALRDLYGQLNPDDPPWPSDPVAASALANVLNHDGITVLVCEVDGAAVGTCMLIVCPNFSRAGRPFALIENVVTDREHRRRGYGRKLIQRAIEIACHHGCYRVTLMTGSRREETLRFYAAAGMRQNTKTAFEARFM